MNKNKLKPAFTLAEVLITLAIIGVVATMTIPALINTTSDSETVTATKKAYASFSQALLKMQPDGYSCLDFSTLDHAGLKNCFASQLNIVKSGTPAALYPGMVYKYFKSSTSWWTVDSDPNSSVDRSLIMNDGMYVTFWNFGNNCTQPEPFDGSGMTNICADFTVDVNGKKPPNQIGYDLAYFNIVRNGSVYSLIPTGTLNDGRTCVSNSASLLTSSGCTAKIIKDGKMP